MFAETMMGGCSGRHIETTVEIHSPDSHDWITSGWFLESP